MSGAASLKRAQARSSNRGESRISAPDIPDLRSSIAAAGQTQREAAELLGVPLRTLEDWCRGIARCPAPIVRLYRHLAGLERIPFRGNSK